MAAKLSTVPMSYQQWETGLRRTPRLAAERLTAAKGKRSKSDWPNEGSIAHKIMTLADGSLDAKTIAKKCGINREWVYRVIKNLSEKGAKVSLLQGERTADAASALRAARVLKAIDAGRSLLEISAAEGVSRQRIHQILKMSGRPLMRQRRAAKRQEVEAQRNAKLREAEQQRKEAARKEAQLADLVRNGSSIRSAAQELGFTRSQAMTLSKRLGLSSITRHGRWRRDHD
ncbi:hypothetical protein [Bradyrhizobium sp. SZCCHNS1054]|uniref:hypothetical protein n=1 Tax=Bradyrhizobium sp. SZCCHNS1054 TaxID=3057301 RepID=UPI00291608E8|nr:hypothetical protein [Bradyrhizobium sp. SZCCHNS1054]